MQGQNKVLKIALAAVMLSLAVIFPQLFHFFPIPNIGKYLLPMHIPVFLCGIICGPFWGLFVGGVAPVLSFFISGMPEIMRLPFMLPELAIYGISVGWFYRLFKKMKALPRLYVSLLIAMLLGRLSYFLSVIVAVNILKLNAAIWYTFIESMVFGIVGVVCQLLLIPLIMNAILHHYRRSCRNLLGEENTFVCKKGKRIHTSQKKGVAPILDLLQKDPEYLTGSRVVDKVIGRAAALLLIKGNVSGLYTEVISKHALEILNQYGRMEVSYGKCVEYIINRAGDDMCPLEKATMNIDDPQQAYDVIIETLEKLKNANK